MKRDAVFAGVGLVLGLCLLGLQFGLTIPARMATGVSFTASLIFYFSFFTILSNIGVALTYLAVLTDWRQLGWFRHHRTRTLFAALILIVMLVYHFVLAGIWAPVGLFKLADIGLHYAAPVFYLIWWFTLRRRETLNYSQIGMMLVPPFVYVVYVLFRGHLTGLYPYPFVDADILGLQQTLINALGLFAITAALLALFIWVDRKMLRHFQE